MKRLRTLDIIKIAFIASFASICIFTGIIYANMRHAETESRNVNFALVTLRSLENMLVKVQAIEAGQRGFTISGDENFLGAYNEAVAKIQFDIKELNNLQGYSADDRRAADTLIALVTEKVAHAKRVVEIRRVQGYEEAAALVQSGTGVVLMNRIMKNISAIENKDRAVLKESNANRETYARGITYVVFVLSALFLLVIIRGYFFIRNDFRKAEVLNTRLAYNAGLLQSISDPIITTDNDGRVTGWNSHAQQLFGYQPGDVTGKSIDELLSRDDIQGFLNSENFEEETPVRELKLYHQNGTLIFADVKTSVLKDGQAVPVGTISVLRDITQRKHLENRLQALSENLQQQVNSKAAELNHVFDRVTDAFIALDNNWIYTHVNEIAATMHGKHPEDLIGKNIWEVFPEVVNEPFYHALHDAAASRLPQRLALYFSKENRWYEDLIYPGADGISVYYHDITQQKKASLALEEAYRDLKFSNSRFEMVSKATNDAVWDWNIETNELWGNESFTKYFDLEPEKLVPFEHFLSRVYPEDSARMTENFKSIIRKKGQLLTEEFRFRDKKGNEKVMYDRAYILYNDAGRAYRMMGAMQDISSDKEAEHKLMLEKELSDSIINSLPGIFYLFNREGVYYRWNKNMELVSGYSAEEMSNIHPLEFFAEAEKPLLVDKITNVFKTGADNVEANLLTKSGKKIPYYFNGMTINYEGEICLMGVGIDISEKVRSQKILQDSEEKFRTVIEQASEAILISDEAGNYLDVNAGAERLTGFSKEEMVSMHVTDLVSTEELAGNPLKFQEMNPGDLMINERQIKRKDGKIIDVEVSASRLNDGRYQAIVRDITEKKKAVEALRASENKYRLLFNQNPLPMWIISSPERKFLDVNNAAVTAYGYSKDEFLKMRVDDLHPQEDLFSVNYDFRKSSEGMQELSARTHIKKDKSSIIVNIISHDIIYEDRKAVIALANDVTEKIEAEEELQRSHEAMRDLASHLETIREKERTHMAREIHDELGQQLTGLKMDISWINRKIQTEDEAVQQKLKDTISLIDKTVITVRRIATQLRPSILDDLGLIAAMEWQTDEFEKRAEMEANFTSNVQHVVVKPDVATGIFRIFQESLTNVLRHSGADKVDSFLSVEKDIITLNIKDNGKGFLEKDIADKKTLGLLGMKERVNLINGTYEINGNTGTGTSVIITVPLS